MTQGSSISQNSPFQLSGTASYNYTNPQVAQILQGSNNTNSTITPAPVNHGVFLTDIAQSHHFTVWIEGFSTSKFKTPEGTFSEFLPVKTMNLNYTSYESMSIPVAIFGDFPLLNKKRVSTIALSCFDMDTNKLEQEIRLWEESCFPNGRYVAYMEDVVKKFVYRGYNVKGQETMSKTMYVMPTGAISVSRDYSANDAKIVNFTLVCVGDGTTCATGSNAPMVNEIKQDIQKADSKLKADTRRFSGDDQTINRYIGPDLINSQSAIS